MPARAATSSISRAAFSTISSDLALVYEPAEAERLLIHYFHAMNYLPKPHPDAYAALCRRLGIAPRRALFVDDMARNLKPAKALGMTTVWLDNGSERGGEDADPGFIDFVADDIGAWLANILEEEVA